MERTIGSVDKERLKVLLEPYIPKNIITDMFENRILTDLWDVLYAAVDYYTGGEDEALEAVRNEKVESVDDLLDKLRWWGKSAESPLDIERIKELLEPYLPEDIIDEALEGEEIGDYKDLLNIAVEYFTDSDRRPWTLSRKWRYRVSMISWIISGGGTMQRNHRCVKTRWKENGIALTKTTRKTTERAITVAWTCT